MKDKTEFLNAVVSAYMTKLENMFTTKYSFEGDDDFDIDAQTLFFRTIFREGQAAIVGITNNRKSIQRFYPNLNKKLGVGNNGVVESAYVFPAWLNYAGSNYGSFSNYITNTDGKGDNGKGVMIRNIHDNKIVFFQNYLGEDVYSGKSLKSELEPFIFELATRHLQASIYNTIAGGKIATTSSPKINAQIENSLYSVGDTLKLDGEYDNETDTNTNMSEEVNQNLTVIRFDLDPNVFLDGIPKYEAIVYKIFGIRINQRFKKERAITGEMVNEDHEFNAADFKLRQSYDNFIIKYKKAFNKELNIIDNLASLADEKGEDNPDEKITNEIDNSNGGGSNE